MHAKSTQGGSVWLPPPREHKSAIFSEPDDASVMSRVTVEVDELEVNDTADAVAEVAKYFTAGDHMLVPFGATKRNGAIVSVHRSDLAIHLPGLEESSTEVTLRALNNSNLANLDEPTLLSSLMVEGSSAVPQSRGRDVT